MIEIPLLVRTIKLEPGTTPEEMRTGRRMGFLERVAIDKLRLLFRAIVLPAHVDSIIVKHIIVHLNVHAFAVANNARVRCLGNIVTRKNEVGHIVENDIATTMIPEA